MTSARRLRIWIPLVFVGLYLGTGGLWWFMNLGDVPHYGDTREYVRLGRTLEVDGYRGIGYPAFLAGVDRLVPGASLLSELGPWHKGGPCNLPRGWILAQLAQTVLTLAALVYFVRTLEGRERGMRAIGLFALLLVFDPLVAHFNLTLMPDGLALAGSLAFGAALTRLLSEPTGAGASLAVLFVSFIATSTLRVEKAAVLLATVLGCLFLWVLVSKRSFARPFSASRAGLTLLATVLAFVCVTGIRTAVHREQGRWPITTSILHQRVVFPHLAEIYDELPASTTEHLSREQAEVHDSHILNARGVVEHVSRGRAELREEFIRRWASTIWRRLSTTIVLDVAKDTLENVFATVSYYLRLGVYCVVGEKAFNERFGPGTSWTHTRLEMHHPRLSRAYLVIALLLAITGLAYFTRGTGSARKPVTVFVVLCLVNAVAFASTADLVHIRYVLLAHVVFLYLVLRRLVDSTVHA